MQDFVIKQHYDDNNEWKGKLPYEPDAFLFNDVVDDEFKLLDR